MFEKDVCHWIWDENHGASMGRLLSQGRFLGPMNFWLKGNHRSSPAVENPLDW